jgi:tetratricopeptide (TPR) repeat protein
LWIVFVVAGIFLGSVARAENEGQADLEAAAEAKISAESLPDLNHVIDLLDTSLEEGLDEENTDLANQMLVTTLIQRAQALSAAILTRPIQDPRKDPRWIQIRQFALSDLQRAVSIDNEQWEAHFLIGRLHILPLGDPNAARRAFTETLKADEFTDKQRSEIYALRGAVQRDEEKRLEDFTKAIELDPANARYLRLRAQYYHAEENHDEALVDIDKAIELETDDAATHEIRGMILLGLERNDEAIAAFDRATELAPEAALPYQHRSEVYRRRGDLQKAIQQLTKALELAPDDLATLLVRAAVYFEAKDYDKALADTDAALQLHPDLLRAHLMRVEILASDNQTDEAIRHLEEIIKALPEQDDLVVQLATLYLINDQPKKAIELFSEVVSRDPENFSALRSRGDSYLNLGEHAKAIADFDAATKLNGEDVGLLNNFAWVLCTSPEDELRDGKRALDMATKACEATAYQAPHILSTLAAAYAELGDFEDAIKWSQKAVELSSDDENSQLEQLSAELAGYKEGKPWRELQQEKKSPEPPSPIEPLVPPSSPTPEPDHIFDDTSRVKQ